MSRFFGGIVMASAIVLATAVAADAQIAVPVGVPGAYYGAAAYGYPVGATMYSSGYAGYVAPAGGYISTGYVGMPVGGIYPTGYVGAYGYGWPSMYGVPYYGHGAYVQRGLLGRRRGWYW